jgi:hypothetical protein
VFRELIFVDGLDELGSRMVRMVSLGLMSVNSRILILVLRPLILLFFVSASKSKTLAF